MSDIHSYTDTLLKSHSFTKPSDPGVRWCRDCRARKPCDTRWMAEEWARAQKKLDRIAGGHPNTVVVVYDDEDGVFVACDDNDTRFIIMDLGSGNAYKVMEGDRSMAEEYVLTWMEQVESLPASSGVRKVVDNVCDKVLRAVGSNLDEFRAGVAAGLIQHDVEVELHDHEPTIDHL